MGKTKHNPPKKSKPNFIEFSKVQQAFLNRVQAEQVKEFNEAIYIVCEELGIVDKIKKAPPGMMYKLRMDDFSGIDILPLPSKDD